MERMDQLMLTFILMMQNQLEILMMLKEVMWEESNKLDNMIAVLQDSATKLMEEEVDDE